MCGDLESASKNTSDPILKIRKNRGRASPVNFDIKDLTKSDLNVANLIVHQICFDDDEIGHRPRTRTCMFMGLSTEIRIIL